MSRWKEGPIVQACQHCGGEFRTWRSEVKRGRGRFCSPSCWSLYARSQPRAKLDYPVDQRDIDRFWAKVARTDDGTCWEWRAGRDEKGYGRYSLKHRSLIASRVAYAITHGPIPAGQVVCHRCDNPACVRPGHLFLGTQRDNMLDRREKWRHRRKLTIDQVREIRRRCASGEKQRAIAREFEIASSSVWAIVHFINWPKDWIDQNGEAA